MKIKKMVTTPAKTEEKVVKVRCDMCLAKGDPDGDDEANWPDGRNNTNETCVKWKFGYSHEDGGEGEKYVLHICPKCFEGKLIPWLESQNVVLSKEKWDY